MFGSTSFYYSSPNQNSGKWPGSSSKSESPKEGRHFKRLNSYEGQCKMVDEKCRPTTKRETRWFGNYHQDQHLRHRRQHLHQERPFDQYHVPYNLTKGQYEFWHADGCTVEPIVQEQNQFVHFSNTMGNAASILANNVCAMPYNFTRQVSSWLGMVPQAISSTFCSTSAATEAEEAVLRVQFYEEHNSPVRSQLNPYAKSFVPLNPNAKEFHPSSQTDNVIRTRDKQDDIIRTKDKSDDVTNKSDNDVFINCDETSADHKTSDVIVKPDPDTDCTKECVTPPLQQVSLKCVADRQSTPWAGHHDVSLSSIHDVSSLHPGSESFDDDLDYDDDDDDDDEDEEDKDGCSRSRLLSTCSEDCIVFQDDPDQNVKRRRRPSSILVDDKFNSDNCSDFLKTFLAGQGDDDTSDQDDDGDWDVDIDTVQDVDVDLLGDCALTCQWMPQSLSKFTEDRSTILDDPYPVTEGNREEVERLVELANDKWRQTYDECLTAKTVVFVNFNDPLVTSVWMEDPMMAEELREARVDDRLRRQADKNRFERILGPIFETDHRQKVWKKLNQC